MPTAAVQRRLSGRDIASVLQTRRQRAGRFVVLHTRRGSEGLEPRFAVVASRRVGNAVARNRAKRVLREAARSLRWRSGTDAVLIARAACARTPMGAVRSELHRLATALDVLDDHTEPTLAAGHAGSATHEPRELDG